MAKQVVQALGWIVAMLVMTSKICANLPEQTRQEVDRLKSFPLENGKQMMLYKAKTVHISIF